MKQNAMTPADRLVDNSDSLLTYIEMAAYLKVSVRTVHRWVALRRIPYKQIGEWSVRFDKSEVVRWLQKRSIHP